MLVALLLLLPREELLVALLLLLPRGKLLLLLVLLVLVVAPGLESLVSRPMPEPRAVPVPLPRSSRSPEHLSSASGLAPLLHPLL